MAIDFAHRSASIDDLPLAPAASAPPDRQLLVHIFARIHSSLAECGLSAFAYMPLSGSRPACCLYAPGLTGDREALQWAADMRQHVADHLQTGFEPDDPTLLDNLAGEADESTLALGAAVRQKVISLDGAPLGLLRCACESEDASVAPGLWEAVARLQARFEAASHVLGSGNLMQDPLTGTYSLTFMEDLLRREIPRAYRHSQQLSLAVLRLRTVGASTPGVVAAGWVRAVVAAVRECVRETDVVAAVGSATLGIVMPNTGTRNALVAVGRIKDRLAEDCAVPRGIECHIGVSGWDITGPHMPEIIEQAMSAMHEARRSGSDRPFLYLA
jgi:diguanylate cyclase (GGDEF)-like protein